MKKIGYARATITENDINSHVQLLSSYGCDEIFKEALNAETSEETTTKLNLIIEQLEENDVLVICKLNQLGRSTRQLTDLTSFFKKSGIHLVSLEEGIDTRQDAGEMYFSLLDGLAAMECELIKERTLIGLNNARKKGKVGGRPKINFKTVQKIRHLYYEKKETIQLISHKCGVSAGTCYKYINLPNEEVAKISQ